MAADYAPLDWGATLRAMLSFADSLARRAGVSPQQVKRLIEDLLPRIDFAAERDDGDALIELALEFGAALEQERWARRGVSRPVGEVSAAVRRSLKTKMRAAGRDAFGLGELLFAAAVAGADLSKKWPVNPWRGITTRGVSDGPRGRILTWRPGT